MTHAKWEREYWPENTESLYLNPNEVQDSKNTDTIPRKGQTQEGYGRAIPTRHMLRVNNRWYRVKVMQYGNAGSAYITIKGRTLFVDDECLKH